MKRILPIFLIIVIFLSACAQKKQDNQAAYTQIPINETIDFKERTISLKQYASLIEINEMISFQEISVENDLGFKKILEQVNQE